MTVFFRSLHVKSAIQNCVLQIIAGLASIIFGEVAARQFIDGENSPLLLAGVFSGPACIVAGIFMLIAALLQRHGKAKVSRVAGILVCLIVAIKACIYNLGASIRYGVGLIGIMFR